MSSSAGDTEPQIVADASKHIPALKEQLDKIEQKSQFDIAFLDELRTFFKTLATFENDHAQNLIKLSQQNTQKAKASSIAIPEQNLAFKLSTNVWQEMVEEHLKSGKRHQKFSEDIGTCIVEPLKKLRSDRVTALRETSIKFQNIHDELAQNLTKIDQLRKTYEDASKLAEHARKEYREISQRYKNDQRKLFESKAAIEKKYQKISLKNDDRTFEENMRRNEYLLNLVATNEHVAYYYRILLPKLLDEFHGTFYAELKACLEKYSTMRRTLAQEEINAQEFITVEYAKISLQYEEECFLLSNTTAFLQMPPILFQPLAHDPTRSLIFDGRTTSLLHAELQRQLGSIATIDTKLALLIPKSTAEGKAPLVSEGTRLELLRLQALAQSKMIQDGLGPVGNSQKDSSNSASSNVPTVIPIRTSFDET